MDWAPTKDKLGKFKKGYKSPKYAMVERKCLVCTEPFLIHKYRALTEPNKGKYCSLKCKGKAFRTVRPPPDTEFKKTNGNTNKYMKLKNKHSREFAEWRKEVFARDKHTCQMCKRRGGIYLHAHHIKPFVEFEESRFDVNNGITYCRNCHAQVEYEVKKDRFRGGKK